MIRGALVLDTSVVIKWFRHGEILAEQALALRKAYLDGEAVISAPDLLIYELANVLRYKTELTTGQVQEAIRSLLDMELEFVPPGYMVMRRAVEIARAYETTIYDAAFPALAESMGAALVTADERLARRLETFPNVHFLGDLVNT